MITNALLSDYRESGANHPMIPPVIEQDQTINAARELNAIHMTGVYMLYKDEVLTEG